MNKPGWKTSEFWVSVLLIGGLELSQLTSINVLPTKYAGLAASATAAAYALARGLAKFKAQPVPVVPPVVVQAPPGSPVISTVDFAALTRALQGLVQLKQVLDGQPLPEAKEALGQVSPVPTAPPVGS